MTVTNKWLATEVMGWHEGVHTYLDIGCYLDKDCNFIMYCKEWNPLTDPGQALMCAEKSGVPIRLFINTVTTQKKFAMYYRLRVRDLDRDELPQAICSAIYEVTNDL